MLFSAWPCVRDHIFKVCEHTNYLWEFYQIYNLDAAGDKNELIRFEIKRSKVKVTARPDVVRKALRMLKAHAFNHQDNR